jgi:hypothetical protein
LQGLRQAERPFHLHLVKWFNLCVVYNQNEKGNPLATPNYTFEKRQRDLAKKQRKEEKRKRKLEPDEPTTVASATQPPNVEKVAP